MHRPPTSRPPRLAARALFAPLALLGASSLALGASAAVEEFQAATAQTPDLDHGGALFATCAACHSTDGSGIDDGSVPAIAAQYYRVIVKELVDFRHDRRWDIRMEHFVDRHHLQTPADIADVAGYVSHLPLRPSPMHGDGGALRGGTSLYFRDCESCHGPLGEGDAARLVPRLAGQHYGYLVREIHDTGDGRRPNMAAEHVQLIRALDIEGISGIADYLSRLRPLANPDPGAHPGPGASPGPRASANPGEIPGRSATP